MLGALGDTVNNRNGQEGALFQHDQGQASKRDLARVIIFLRLRTFEASL